MLPPRVSWVRKKGNTTQRCILTSSLFLYVGFLIKFLRVERSRECYSDSDRDRDPRKHELCQRQMRIQLSKTPIMQVERVDNFYQFQWAVSSLALSMK